MDSNPYPPIGDYGYIADCHASALVSKAGSVDWCCLPRIDSKSCFARLLDWDHGGFCQIAPLSDYRTTRRYLPDTLVLETTFRTETGEARLLDCFAVHHGSESHPHRQMLRVVEGLRGRVQFRAEIQPCFDYGAVKAWIRHKPQRDAEAHIAIGGSDGLLISGDFPLTLEKRHALTGCCTVEAGQRLRLSLLYRPAAELDEGRITVPDMETLDRRLDETIAWWRDWSALGGTVDSWGDLVRRSAIVLKGLSNAPTGAIAAAATTSLPECPGGSRNWDYRYSWVRDSTFAVDSLADLGYLKEADEFRRFIERSAAGSADELQVMFGMGGERRLHEHEIPELAGYRHAKPVRVGNSAESQLQLDVYGELMELAWRWHRRGRTPDRDYWEFLTGLITAAVASWRKPDRGFWELRGEQRHFVQSKVMCWAALDRGIKLVEELHHPGPVEDWKRAREEIRRWVEEHGYDHKRGVFIQAAGHPIMDAALLLLPAVGFVPFDDERMVRTTDAIRSELGENGLLRRYPSGTDGMRGHEGVFLPCSFWLAECLACQKRCQEAKEVLECALATGNDLGLFSEEYDTAAGEMLGNFPQALTHLSLISAIVALAKMEKSLATACAQGKTD